MTSSDPSRVLDLEHDLPTSPEDVAALRRAKGSSRPTLAEYLRFLAHLPAGPSAPVARKPGGPPFVL
jgi:hypothetical protein